MPHYPIYDLDQRYRKVSRRHESSARRTLKKLIPLSPTWQVIAILTLCALAVLSMQCVNDWHQREDDKPLPPAITPQQRQRAGEIEKRFSLAGWTWAVETPGKIVDLYDPAIRGWRRIK